MKKVISILLIIALCFCLVACGQNIETFCGGSSIKWDGYEGQHNDKFGYYATFEDGTLTIEKREAKADSGSPTGKRMEVVETKTYSYELQGNDTVIIDGETYTYSFSSGRVEFDKDLCGIESWWKQ